MPAENVARDSRVVSLGEWKDPIELKWQEGDRQVVIVPKDQPRFIATLNKAIQVCQTHISRFEEFQKQFDNLLLLLHGWANEREARINTVYLAVRDAGLLFVVVRNEVPYDSEFEDELTDLDLKIAHDKNFDKIRLNVLALPNASMESIATFLSPEYTLSLVTQEPDAE